MTITATSDNQIRKSNIRNWTIGLQTFATGSLPRSGLVQRDVMEYRRSFRLDVGRPDHPRPLLGLVGDELAKVGRRAGKWGFPEIGKPRLHLGIGKASVDLLVEQSSYQLIGFLRGHLVDVLAQLVHAFNFTQKAISHRRRPFSRLRLRCRNLSCSYII